MLMQKGEWFPTIIGIVEIRAPVALRYRLAVGLLLTNPLGAADALANEVAHLVFRVRILKIDQERASAAELPAVRRSRSKRLSYFYD